MAQVTGTAKIALVECYLKEEDPPEDHDLVRYGAVCGRCFNALSELEREARKLADRIYSPSCGGCGAELQAANAWMEDGCPCNSPKGVNDGNQLISNWRLDLLQKSSRP